MAKIFAAPKQSIAVHAGARPIFFSLLIKTAGKKRWAKIETSHSTRLRIASTTPASLLAGEEVRRLAECGENCINDPC
jgi:hypothetical protein